MYIYGYNIYICIYNYIYMDIIYIIYIYARVYPTFMNIYESFIGT